MPERTRDVIEKAYAAAQECREVYEESGEGCCRGASSSATVVARSLLGSLVCS